MFCKTRNRTFISKAFLTISLVLILESGLLTLRMTFSQSWDSSSSFQIDQSISSEDEESEITVTTPSEAETTAPIGRPWVFESLPENEEERKFYRLNSSIVHPFNYDFLINGSDICDENTSVIILVHSTFMNYEKRKAIRTTWGSISRRNIWPHNRTISENVRLGFIFGDGPGWSEKLHLENSKDGGVIQGNFVDSYNNLTLKSLLGLKWAVQFCPSIKYFIKSDDDMFINIPYLFNILNRREPLLRTMIGPLSFESRVMRSGKWKVTLKQYPFKRYPPYESGSTYIFTGDIVGELFEAAKYVPQIFIDDVYITGILSRVLAIKHALQYGFAFHNSKVPSVCDILLDKVITVHRLHSKRLTDLWKNMHTTDIGKCKELDFMRHNKTGAH